MVKGSKNKNNSKNRNAFYYFMLDFKNQQGRSYRSMNDVASAAGPHWQKLSAEQRRKYENIAKQNRDNQQKQTSIGESVDVVLQEEKYKRDREISMKGDIENIINKGVNMGTIKDQYFYLMHINDFCYWESGNRHYPAEIALAKFNLKNGIIKEDVYHSLFQPGPLPLGYSAVAKIKAEESHQIQHMGSENNLEEVLIGLISKLTEDAHSDKFPPIFVMDSDVYKIENILGHMCDDYGENNVFTIYSLQYLLYCLKNSISPKGPTGGNAWPTVSVSRLELEKDVYDFCNGIACAYHENSEIPIYCSRSQIIRWAYIICDNCIGDLNIPIKPGQHVPVNALTDINLLDVASGITTKSPYAASTSYGSTSKYHTDAASEVSTVADDTESSYHGFDSDSQVADDELEWKQPRRTVKYRHPEGLSQNSEAQLSQGSSAAEFVPSRRPISQSAVGLGRSHVMIGRGRGRGILQTKPPI